MGGRGCGNCVVRNIFILVADVVDTQYSQVWDEPYEMGGMQKWCFKKTYIGATQGDLGQCWTIHRCSVAPRIRWKWRPAEFTRISSSLSCTCRWLRILSNTLLTSVYSLCTSCISAYYAKQSGKLAEFASTVPGFKVLLTRSHCSIAFGWPPCNKQVELKILLASLCLFFRIQKNCFPPISNSKFSMHWQELFQQCWQWG